MRRLIAGLIITLLVPRAVRAQGDCFPALDSHEAQLFAALAVPLTFSLAETPGGARPERLRLGLEVTYLPNFAAEIRTPTVCRPGKGPENTDLLFALPRPRVWLNLPAGLLLEASWVPPLRLNGVRANLIGLGLQRSFPLVKQRAVLSLRAHGAFGLIKAPITCNDTTLRDPRSWLCSDGANLRVAGRRGHRSGNCESCHIGRG